MKQIGVKLHKAKLEMGKVKKNAKNPHFRNTYADINALIEAVEPVLLSQGLILMQPIEDGQQKTVIFDPESGESVESGLPLSDGLSAQQMGSMITYYRRYTLQSLLALQADDDDGEKATKPVFNEAMFASAKAKGATIAKIKSTCILTNDMEKKYLNYLNNG